MAEWETIGNTEAHRKIDDFEEETLPVKLKVKFIGIKPIYRVEFYNNEGGALVFKNPRYMSGYSTSNYNSKFERNKLTYYLNVPY